MNIKGYDAWKLAGPPEWDGPSCDYCGGIDDIRVQCPGIGRKPPELVCEECFAGQDDGPCFDDLQPAAEYYQDQADARADYLHDQARDRRMEDKES